MIKSLDRILPQYLISKNVCIKFNEEIPAINTIHRALECVARTKRNIATLEYLIEHNNTIACKFTPSTELKTEMVYLNWLKDKHPEGFI